jgi:beta-lactamase class A
MKPWSAALMLALAALSGPGVAQDRTAPPASAPAATPPQTALEARAEQVVALVNGKAEPAEIFTARFRAVVPDAQLKSLNANLTAQFGVAVSVALDPQEGTRAKIEIKFERGLAKGSIGIQPDEDNRVGELLITSVEPLAVAGDTPQAITAELAALPGTVNAWFGPLGGGAPLVAINADKPLALGSAIKLYVLAALAEDVKAGRRKWTDVVPLSEKSYPSGQLQNWPKGGPVTLHTLASLMISISDNTATDQLIATLGKQRILEAMRDSGHGNPAANDPFLTTRELFLLKASPDALIDIWRKGGTVTRSATAEMLAQTNVPLDKINAAFANGPRALDIEWFASPADIARLFAFMRRTGDPKAFEILAINSQASAAIKEAWRYVGFKGGSEPGVINLTWIATDKAGRDWVLTLGWNNPAAAVDDAKFLSLAQRILLLPR